MDFIYEKSTKKDFETALEDLKKNLKNHSFGVVVEVDLKDNLREKGQDFNKNFTVLEVCNPVKANFVLTNHIEAGYMLPCKMGVYEKDGEVRIGMLNPMKLIGFLDAKDLQSVADEVFSTLSQAIDETI